MVSIKPGTAVELIAREAGQITIRYKGLTGKISASRLEEPATSVNEKPGDPKKAAKPEASTQTEKRDAENRPANPPQTNYGKAVQKAKDNAAAHDKNVVRPTDEVLKDR